MVKALTIAEVCATVQHRNVKKGGSIDKASYLDLSQ
jgi:hypothetical protein